MISIELVGGQELIARLQALPQKLSDALYREVDLLSVELLDRVKRKLSGEVLHVRTGALRASAFRRVVRSGNYVRATVAEPSSVPYAAIHEFGGTIHHPGGTPYMIDSSGSARFVSKSADIAKNLPVTKPHLITIPERSYLRSSLREMAPRIRQRLTDVIKRMASQGLHK